MRRLRAQAGLTLVELVVVLAISAMFAAAIIMGQGQLRQNAAFTSAMDRVQAQVKSVQNEAIQDVADRQAGAGSPGRSDGAVFGKMLVFDATSPDASKQMTEYTLVGDANDPTAELQMCDPVALSLEQGLHYKGTGGGTNQQAVVFANNTSGSTSVYAINDFSMPAASTSRCGNTAVTVTPPRSYSCPYPQTWDGSECSTPATPPPPPPSGPSAPSIVVPASDTAVTVNNADITVQGESGNCFFLQSKDPSGNPLPQQGPLCDNTTNAADTVTGDGRVQFHVTFTVRGTYTYTATQARCPGSTCSTPQSPSDASSARAITFSSKPSPPVITNPDYSMWWGTPPAQDELTVQGTPGNTARIYIKGAQIGSGRIGINGLATITVDVPMTADKYDPYYYYYYYFYNQVQYDITATQVSPQGLESDQSAVRHGATLMWWGMYITVLDYPPYTAFIKLPSLVETAHAAAAADPLSPASYIPNGPYWSSMDIPLEIEGDTAKSGKITVNPPLNTVTRSFN